MQTRTHVSYDLLDLSKAELLEIVGALTAVNASDNCIDPDVMERILPDISGMLDVSVSFEPEEETVLPPDDDRPIVEIRSENGGFYTAPLANPYDIGDIRIGQQMTVCDTPEGKLAVPGDSPICGSDFVVTGNVIGSNAFRRG